MLQLPAGFSTPKTLLAVAAENSESKGALFSALASKFVEAVADVRSTHGYLPNRLSDLAAQQVLRQRTVVAGWDSEVLAGYWIADHYRYTYTPERYAYFAEAGNRVAAQRNIDLRSICFGAQCVIDIPYQGLGLRTFLLYALVSHLQGRYQYVFSKITRDNPRALRGHHKDGWLPVDGDVEEEFVILEVKAALRWLAGQFVSDDSGASNSWIQVVAERR